MCTPHLDITGSGKLYDQTITERTFPRVSTNKQYVKNSVCLITKQKSYLI